MIAADADHVYAFIIDSPYGQQNVQAYAKDGTLLWTSQDRISGAYDNARYLLTQDMLIIASPDDNTITAVSTSDGTTTWRWATDAIVSHGYSLAADAEHLYVGTAYEVSCLRLKHV